MAAKGLTAFRIRPPCHHCGPCLSTPPSRSPVFYLSSSSGHVWTLHLRSYNSTIHAPRPTPISSRVRFPRQFQFRLPPPPPTRRQHAILHSSLVSNLRGALFGTSVALALLFGYVYITDTRSGVHILTPSVLKYVYDDAEDAHEVGNAWLRGLYFLGLHPRERSGGKVGDNEADLSIQVCIYTYRPVGSGYKLTYDSVYRCSAVGLIILLVQVQGSIRCVTLSSDFGLF